MKNERDLEDQLDKFAKGQLTADELAQLKAQMKQDPALEQKAEEHIMLVQALKAYSLRETTRQTLAEIPLETPTPELPHTPPVGSVPPAKSWGRYWPTIAVAASVAFLSILGTLFMTQSLETKQTAYYKELRRNVEQIKNEQIKMSQNMMADKALAKEKAVPLPGRYAGTGFLVSGNGYVITSYHVIKGADSVYIENEKFGLLKTTLVASDAANDVSVLRIDSGFSVQRALPFVISASEANLGEDVYTLGFPREDVIFGEGSISATSGYRQNPNAYQVSVPVNPGNSGGPLFNGKGDLVGIISGIQTETSGAAFALKSSVLLDVIKELPVDTLYAPLVLPKQNTLRHLSKIEKVRRWKDYVFVVRVYNHKG